MSVNDPEKLYFYFNFLELNEGLIYIEGSSHCQSNVMGNHSALRNSPPQFFGHRTENKPLICGIGFARSISSNSQGGNS